MITSSVQCRDASQWSADNVDHNVRTLDGKGTLHGMGVIVSSTGLPDQNTRMCDLPAVPREKRKLAADAVANTRIPIEEYIAPNVAGLSKLSFTSQSSLRMKACTSEDTALDLLWHASHFREDRAPRPGWNGFFQAVTVSSGKYPGKSVISMLPIIDMNPGDRSCIYSVLCFISNQARELGIPTPVVTFDQPLWIKAVEIVIGKDMHMVVIP